MSPCNCTGACLRGEGCSARPARIYGPWYGTPPPLPSPMATGWLCPACGHGNAPWIPYCGNCRRNAEKAAPLPGEEKT